LRRQILPIIERRTPVLDALRGWGFRERRLLGFLASTPEEIRSLRRGIVVGLGTSLTLSILLPKVLSRVRGAGIG